jgi:glutamine cyclotransferase
MTHDGKSLIVSDGTEHLYFWDPETLKETRRITVKDAGVPVRNLNELEFVDGEIYANVWQQDRIARISPATGRVLSWIDLSGLLAPEDRHGGEDVLNGIAYDAGTGRLFVTGKLWPKVYEIEILPKSR